MKTLFNKEIIQDMRDWCFDCCNNDEEIELVESMEDWQIVGLVKKNFEGGIEGFLNTYATMVHN